MELKFYKSVRKELELKSREVLVANSYACISYREKKLVGSLFAP